MSFNSLLEVPFTDLVRLICRMATAARPMSAAELEPVRQEYSRYYDGLYASVDAVNLIERYLETILRAPNLQQCTRILAERALNAVQTHVALAQSLLDKSLLIVARDANGRRVDLANARATQDAVESGFRNVVLHMLKTAHAAILEAQVLVNEFNGKTKLMDANSAEVREHAACVRGLTDRFSDASNNLITCLNHTATSAVPDAAIAGDWPTTRNTLCVAQQVTGDVYKLVRPHFALERIESARRVEARERARAEQAARVAMAEQVQAEQDEVRAAVAEQDAYNAACLERAKAAQVNAERAQADQAAYLAAKAERAEAARSRPSAKENTEENTEEECE